MKRFWKVQVQYRTARALIHAGLWVMPEGRYKRELLTVLWELGYKVMDAVHSPQNVRKETRGLFDRLTPEQKAAALSYRGPEASGDQSLPKRRR